jgi:hypothetical protein
VKKETAPQVAGVINDAFKRATEAVQSGDQEKVRELGGIPAP